jgi:hypothetical protein
MQICVQFVGLGGLRRKAFLEYETLDILLVVRKIRQMKSTYLSHASP